MPRPFNHITPFDRFAAKVSKIPTCWLWTGHATPCRKGRLTYGVFKIKNRSTLVHRFSYEHHKGEIPEGLKVLHTCDNPLCVNPEHLFVGTQADNVRDCVAKDRHSRGEVPVSAKLTDDAVRDIRANHVPYSRTHGSAAFAKKYGVSGVVVEGVVAGKRWRHVHA